MEPPSRRCSDTLATISAGTSGPGIGSPQGARGTGEEWS